MPAGFVLAPLLLVSAEPSVTSIVAGSAVSIIGLVVRAWASGHLRKNQELTTSGPYARTRNPLYLGTFILGTGIAVGGGAPWFVALFMALYLLIYVPVMLAEAETMRDLFSEEYDHYSKRVPLFLPRLTPYRAPSLQPGGEARSNRRFDRSRYLKHREYRAAVGLAVVYALLAAKFFFVSG
ncbi:MAG TPA: isoprenylcysteine carboxylmethyltransferase family protein [Blastocatellia bacterium]|nr:isoprenylcysteine carboxylmethyltransferase family protein [Blastocatellia bacterium]